MALPAGAQAQRPKRDRSIRPDVLGRPRGTPAHVFADKYEEAIRSKRKIIRDLVMEHGRLDIFCEYILGGERPTWFQQDMMDFQDGHPEGLILAFRGARKTSFCTIARALVEIIRNPNIRILFAAEATDQSKIFLRAIKSHFEHNTELIETFGDFKTGAEKWTDSEIIVGKRTVVGMKESTIHCVGVDTSLPSRHYDIIIADDLVTEDNSLTPGQRNKIRNYYYKTLLPCLESPTGRMWVIGTRWHDEDLYGHLAAYDYKDSTITIGVIDEETDQSIWEEKFPTERMHRIRQGSLAAFELQWMCRSGGGLGGIFNESHFIYYDSLPFDIFKWQGVDLAAGQKAANDFFAHATLGIRKVPEKHPFLIEIHERKMPFPQQVLFINDRFRDHPDTIRVGIEANAYQLVMTQAIRAAYPDIPAVPRWTLKDKVARAQQLATLATDNPIHVRRSHSKFVRRMCAFPNGPKDAFDAFDLAMGLGMTGVKRKRTYEPGLI